MANLAIVHERTGTGGWRPVGVLFAAGQRIDFKFRPASDWQGWAQNRIANVTPASTWEAELPTFANRQSNGADLWITTIDNPEITLDQNYQRYVLGATPTALPSPAATPADAIPELGGFKKVTPAR